MAQQKKDGDVVTSAPASQVGSLLTDLLNDAKESVAQEQKQIESESDRRAREEREVRDREEGRKREAAQQKLIEETRRRNEALSKRERNDGERKALSTAPHMRPVTDQPADAPKSAELAVVAPAKAPNKLMLAALVIIGVGIGLGTAMALSPSPRDAGIDVAGAAKAIVAATKKQASAEGKVLMELEAARNQIADLQKAVGETQGAHKALEQQLATLKTELASARTEMEAAGKTDKGPRRTGGGGGGTPGGIPTINGSIFNK